MAPPRGERPTRRKESARPPLSPPRAAQTMATVENPPAPPVLEPVQPSPELVPSPPREGLMNDRFKSLQARNLIEPRRKASKNRTRKVNKVTKNSAKDTKYKSPHALKAGLKLPAWM